MLNVAPDRPGSLSFIVKTPSSVLVSWTPPSPRTNGIVTLYELVYYQDSYVDGKTADMFPNAPVFNVYVVDLPLNVVQCV